MTHAGADDTLVAYSSMEDGELADYVSQIERDNPDLHIKVIRVSTAALHERILQEGDAGQWDIIFGWSLTKLLDPMIQTLLATFDSAQLDRLPREARDEGGKWFSPSAFVPAFCVNEARLKEKGLPVPRNWNELAESYYGGEIVLPDPAYSGAGFLHVTALNQKSGSAYVDSVFRRVANSRPRVVRSAFEPCSAVLNGEAAIGVTVSTAVCGLMNQGVDVRMVIPSDAAAFEPESFAIRAGSRHLSQAQRALDWTMSSAACETYGRYGKVVLKDIDIRSPEGGDPRFPAMTAINAAKANQDRDAMCSAWSRFFN